MSEKPWEGHTPGPWRVYDDGDDITVCQSRHGSSCFVGVVHEQVLWEDDAGMHRANAALIAAAPTHLAELATLRAENARLRGENAALRLRIGDPTPITDDGPWGCPMPGACSTVAEIKRLRSLLKQAAADLRYASTLFGDLNDHAQAEWFNNVAAKRAEGSDA